MSRPTIHRSLKRKAISLTLSPAVLAHLKKQVNSSQYVDELIKKQHPSLDIPNNTVNQ